jgi:DNA-binding response OmpR family regulator
LHATNGRHPTNGRHAPRSPAAARRPDASPEPGPVVRPAPLRAGALEFDVLRRTVRIGADTHALTWSTFALLYLLAVNDGRVLTDREIGEALWRPGEMPLRGAVDHLVVLLRSQLRHDPAHPGIVETVPGRGYRLAAAAGSASLGGRGAVLVVEDDAAVRETVRVVLEMAGYRVMAAADVGAALAAIEVVEPAVVLLGGDTPDAAAELADRWRARSDRVAPIVVMAAAEGAQRRCEELGGDACLPRPFSLEELYAAVEPFCRPAAQPGSLTEAAGAYILPLGEGEDAGVPVRRRPRRGDGPTAPPIGP